MCVGASIWTDNCGVEGMEIFFFFYTFNFFFILIYIQLNQISPV